MEVQDEAKKGIPPLALNPGHQVENWGSQCTRS